MIALIMAASLIGTVILIGVCAPVASSALPVPPTPYSFEQSAGPAICEDFIFDFPITQDVFSANTEGEYEMQTETIRNQMRRGIVEKSVQILRGHGMSDEEIRIIILNDFHIDEETLTEILNSN